MMELTNGTVSLMKVKVLIEVEAYVYGTSIDQAMFNRVKSSLEELFDEDRKSGLDPWLEHQTIKLSGIFPVQ